MGRFSFNALALIFVSLTLLPLALAEEPTYSNLPSNHSGEGDDSVGIRWAVLIAGSSGYGNYRHQADVCHAYQILKKGGLKDENIIVFMYDDIAQNKENPRPGVIINSPNGSDVYKGVPKDYTGEAVNVNNFLSVILGNKTALKGGSGKVVNSGSNDRIFIYYTDHGGPGVLGMPTGPFLFAKDLIDVLKKKHGSGTYKSLVFYLESCESGSIFEGLLPQGLNIYVTTAANATENSWGTYCPGDSPAPPPHEYTTCLGDLYSISWMEDCDVHNMGSETLNEQYELVKNRTAIGDHSSHVMQYGNLNFRTDDLSTYFGIGNNNFNIPPANHKLLLDSNNISFQQLLPTNIVHQRDADILYFWNKFWSAPQGSSRKIDAEKEFVEAMSSRMHVDKSIKIVGKLLVGTKKVLTYARPAGQPLVDDWECLKSLVKTYESFCGPLSQYGMKHMRSFANMCNIGITNDQMAEAAGEACATSNVVIPTNT